jgi:phosphoglycolate phosphatase
MVFVFDFDGTLVDTMEAYTQVASSLLEQYYEISSEEARKAYRLTSGKPFSMQLFEFFPRQPSLNAKVNEEFVSQKYSILTETLPFPDVPPVLTQLKQQGQTIVISSNNEEPLLLAYLSRQAIPYDYALGFTPTYRKGIAHFAKIRTILNDLSPPIFIGDSLHDAHIAAQSAIPFIARIGTFSIQDFHMVDPKIVCISNLYPLLDGELIKKLSGSLRYES